GGSRARPPDRMVRAPARGSVAVGRPAWASGGGSSWPSRPRAPRTWARPRAAIPLHAPSRASLRALERGSQERGNFFLDLHQCLGPLGALLPPHDLALLLSDLLVPRIGRRGLWPPRLRREPREFAPIPRRAPGRQVRGV